MSNVALVPQKSDIWWIFLLQGFAGIIIGLMLVTEPGATLVALMTVLGFHIALAGLWGSPISGASMNPARTFGPDLVATDFTSYWVYVAGPLVGAVLAVGAAWMLRGAGGGRTGSGAAQGTLFTEVEYPDKG